MVEHCLRASLLHLEAALQILGDKSCSEGIFLTDSDVGRNAGCWLGAAVCLTPVLLQENSARQPDKGMQPQALPASGLCASGCDSEALGFPRAGEVAPAQIMQHLPSITTPRDV